MGRVNIFCSKHKDCDLAALIVNKVYYNVTKKSCRRAEGQKAEEEERLRELGYSVAGFRLLKKCLFLAFFLLGYSVAGSNFFLAIANLTLSVDQI